MEYKRKVSTQQEGISGNDSEYGELKMLARSKRTMPYILATVMVVLALSIFSADWEVLFDNTLLVILGLIFALFAFLQIAMTMDKIEFYEYGMIDYSVLNLRKRRLAYDEIDAIVETKKRPLWKMNEQTDTAFWNVYPKQKKGTIMIDASAYNGIHEIITSLRHDTKIKNVAD